MSLWLEAELCRLTGRWGRGGGEAPFVVPGADPVASGRTSAGILQRVRKREARRSERLVCSARSLPSPQRGGPGSGASERGPSFTAFFFGSQIKMFFFLSGHGGACWLMHVFSNSVVLWLQKPRPWCCWCPVTRVCHRASGALAPRGTHVPAVAPGSPSSPWD